MNKFKIKLEYDGTNYVGWQSQDNGISIQECIEIAIKKLTNENVRVYGAGRTDAGVHALEQVAHFEINKDIKTENIRDGLNQHLKPNTIAIINAEKVDDNFHARFSAKLRSYEYRVINRRTPLTIDLNRAWCVYKKLKIDKMINEASSFLGEHDFESFRSSNCQSSKTIKNLKSFDIKYKNDNLFFNITAKSFLHSQVRIMVGTLIDIGKGIIDKSIVDILNSKNRSLAGTTAPACGLYLKKIYY